MSAPSMRTHIAERGVVTMLRYVVRYKWLPFLGLIIGFCFGLGLLLLVAPDYRASTRVMLDPQIIRTEAEIIKSVPVLSKVAGTLALYKDKRFTEPNIFERIVKTGHDENTQRERVLSRLLRMITVRILDGTAILEISVHHPNPDRAAQIANVVLSSYRERKMDERFEASRELTERAKKNLEAARLKMDSSKSLLHKYRQENSEAIALLDSDGQGESEALRLSLIDTESRMDALKKKLDKAEADVSKGRTATRKASLKNEEKAILQQLGILGQRYGEKHPKIIALNAALQTVRSKMASSVPDPRTEILSMLAAEEKKLASLEANLERLSKSYSEKTSILSTLSALESDAAIHQRLYENLLMRYQTVEADAEYRESDLRIISMASIPSKPDLDLRVRVVLLLGLLGFVLGAAFVFIKAIFNTGFTSVAQLEGMTGYPVFAAIPETISRKNAVHVTMAEKPAAVLAESLRSLRVALRLRSEGGARGPRVVAMTSTLPYEGKTSLAVMLAMIAAKSGERVCIVDCDLRRPSVHKAYGIGNARGLQDYLTGDSGMDDIIYRRDPSGVHLVTAKAVPTYSLTLLTSGRMEKLIGDLREQYDLIILDAPSSLAFADARVLARMVDQLLYVVAWNSTRRAGVLSSLKAYSDMRYASLALVLNKVEMQEYLRESASAILYQYGQEEEVVVQQS